MKVSALTFLVFVLLTLPASGSEDGLKSSTLKVTVTVLDNCLMTSAQSSQMSTYLQTSTRDLVSGLNVLCNMGTPYNLSVEDQDGTLSSNMIVAEDGFGYQYHIEKDESGTYIIEMCDSLAEVPVSDEIEQFQMNTGNESQPLDEPPKKVTVIIDW